MKMRLSNISICFYIILLTFSIKISSSPTVIEPAPVPIQHPKTAEEYNGKAVIYQMMTRLFANTNPNNVPWGTVEQNGITKLNDISDRALQSLKEFGVTHVWYTGILHHALVEDLRDYGISLDDPDVIKGRAGSPYAVKDYYSINPMLAEDVNRRMEEFAALVDRTHAAGLKVIIDIVPNHVARHYESTLKPAGVKDFGDNDDTSVMYARDNNFYYIPNEAFSVPEWRDDYLPLGGDRHPLVDGEFNEQPTKWTGSGSKTSQPDMGDWYETVRINFGVRPDGSKDFPILPASYRRLDFTHHARFWSAKDIPDSWKKFEHIVQYWLALGVDGFRFDMAGLVPVEFWSFLNSSIKTTHPEAFLLAEIYQPERYHDYINLGLFDYLYDKVEFYDELKAVMQQRRTSRVLNDIEQRNRDINPHLLRFLENHDEQRIASPEFTGDPELGLVANAVSLLSNSAPYLHYFGQETAEPGALDMGFGDPSRTTIFDYASVPTLLGYINDGKFDDGGLDQSTKRLKEGYRTMYQLASQDPVALGSQLSIVDELLAQEGTNERTYGFIRKHGKRAWLVLANMDIAEPAEVTIEQQLVEEKLGFMVSSRTTAWQWNATEISHMASGQQAMAFSALLPAKSAIVWILESRD